MRQTRENSFFRSKVFRSLFLSYVVIILVFVCLYAASYVILYKDNLAAEARQAGEQEAYTWALHADQQLLTAQSICNALNASENCRTILQATYIEHQTIDSMQLYRVLNDILHVKTSANDMNVYSVLLGFQGDEKFYTPSTVISLDGQIPEISFSQYIGLTSVSRLLSVKCGNILINKEYLTYADHYTALNYSRNARGIILVLFDCSMLRTLADSLRGISTGSCIVRDGSTVFSTGDLSGVPFTVDSVACSGVSYSVYVPSTALTPAFPFSGLLPLLVLALTGCAFIVITYGISKRYYQPIDRINQLMDSSGRSVLPSSDNELEGLLASVRDLVGERNGYREKMLTIAPYARQGVLRSLISGSEAGQQILVDDQFMELRRDYLVLSLINICFPSSMQEAMERKYHDAQEIIAMVCRSFSTEERTVICITRDEQEQMLVVCYDDPNAVEQLFYELYERITAELDDRGIMLTIGVSGAKRELDQLRDAAEEA